MAAISAGDVLVIPSSLKKECRVLMSTSDWILV